MTEIPADPPKSPRRFSSSESATLRRVRVDEAAAGAYPHRLSVSGIIGLIDAGVSAADVADSPAVLNAAALLAFRDNGHDVADADYADRFFDPGLLAEEGVPASIANSYPSHFTEVDVARLHHAGATPDQALSYPASWESSEIAAFVSHGVTPDQAETWQEIVGVPADAIAKCVKAGADPREISRFVEVVGAVVRAPDHTLVNMALDSTRLHDPEAVRDDLLTVAIRSIDATDEAPEHKTALAETLEQIVRRGGELSTSIPNSWNRRRVLHVGPVDQARATLAVSPDEPLRFNDGEIDLDDGVREVRRYCAGLTA